MKNIYKNSFFAALLTLTFCAAAPCAVPEGDPVFKAMNDEMARSMGKLKMDNLQKPYFMAYTVTDGTGCYISATFGATEGFNSYPYRRVKAEVRVGDKSFDNTNYVGNAWGEYRPSVDYGVAMNDNYDSLRFSIWSLTDEAYKSALDNYSKKKAFKESKNMTELYDDLTAEPVYTAFLPVPAERLDEKLWTERMKKLSAVFTAYPAVKYSQVTLSYDHGAARFLNSEGSAFKKPYCSGAIEIEAKTYSPDGYKLGASSRFGFCAPADLPPFETIVKKAEQMAARLTDMNKSVTMKAYIGPVLFEENAAARFFDHFFVNNIANPREIWKETNKWSTESVYRRAGELVERLDMRVMPPFLNVVDDPLATEYNGAALMGHYTVDDEGVPARKVTLVEKGKLKDVYRFRAATRDFKTSNGHGRGEYHEYTSGGPGNVFIEPQANSPRVLSMPELKKKFLDLCREQELEYCLLVRDIDSFRGSFSAYKVYTADGREEPVHAIEFIGAGLRSLRDIVAVSKEMKVYNLAWTPPASLVAPSILVQEMELKKTEDKPDRIPYLAHPFFAK
ncbi:MAG: metallopeptidase TldD-related protein [Elusimicrobia bacterium]|nr:metallopeptidase TldD-related protein [Elusimicrobiota bacterium]